MTATKKTFRRVGQTLPATTDPLVTATGVFVNLFPTPTNGRLAVRLFCATGTLQYLVVSKGVAPPTNLVLGQLAAGVGETIDAEDSVDVYVRYSGAATYAAAEYVQ